jgi:hypothetical protein
MVDLEPDAKFPHIRACVWNEHTRGRIQSRIGPTLRRVVQAIVAEGAKEVECHAGPDGVGGWRWHASC